MPFIAPYIQEQTDLLNDVHDLKVDVLRLDVTDTVISGNKWFKLKNYLAQAGEAGKEHILTFGGAYSNHIVATAGACRQFGFQSTGIIRGESPKTFSHTLLKAKELGMQLHFVSRTAYREKLIPDHINPNDYFMIPEGGYGIAGAAGISEMLQQFNIATYSHIFCAVGTGTMMAGLVNACPENVNVIGIPILKSMPGIEDDVKKLLTDAGKKKFMFIDDFHFGGYAKYNKTLTRYMNDFYQTNNIPTDFVYTGKLFYAVSQLTATPGFRGKKILVIHSGGLQGNYSLPGGTLMF